MGKKKKLEKPGYGLWGFKAHLDNRPENWKVNVSNAEQACESVEQDVNILEFREREKILFVSDSGKINLLGIFTRAFMRKCHQLQRF